jgi:hypothetical protein
VTGGIALVAVGPQAIIPLAVTVSVVVDTILAAVAFVAGEVAVVAVGAGAIRSCSVAVPIVVQAVCATVARMASRIAVVTIRSATLIAVSVAIAVEIYAVEATGAFETCSVRIVAIDPLAAETETVMIAVVVRADVVRMVARAGKRQQPDQDYPDSKFLLHGNSSLCLEDLVDTTPKTTRAGPPEVIAPAGASWDEERVYKSAASLAKTAW